MKDFFGKNREVDLWAEKYRPKTLESYIGNTHIKDKVTRYIEEDEIPHLLFYGKAGTGKTTLAKIIVNNISCDILYINASDENSVDTIRSRVKHFASSVALNNIRVVILDEFDYMTANAQAALRNLMETFVTTTRFILTCVNKGTKVYCENGYKRVENLKDNETILTNYDVNVSKKLNITSKNKLLRIKTLHGNDIEVTPEHQFMIDGAWKRANLLQLGDQISVNYEKIFGNDFELTESEYSIFDTDDFKNWLISDNKIPTESVVEDIHRFYEINNLHKNSHKMLMRDDIISICDEILNMKSTDYNKISALGRILGFVYRDDHLTDGDGIHFAGNKDCLRKVQSDLDVLNIEYGDIRKNGYENGNGYGFWVHNKSFNLLLQYVGCPVGTKVDQMLSIPRICYKDNLLMKSFIQSLFDCEMNTPKIENDNLSVRPITFRQYKVSYCANKDTFFRELQSVLLEYFDIDVKYSKADFDHEYKDDRKRVIQQLQISNTVDIIKFYRQIGSYYESSKRVPSILAYLEWKVRKVGYTDFLTYEDWKEKYYDNGIVNDEIIDIQVLDGDFTVYDPCMEIEHSYISNGFISHNCNYVEKIIDPIVSRTQAYKVFPPKKSEIAKHLCDILENESVEYEKKDIALLVNKHYPDIRKVLNTAQQNTIDGKLSIDQDSLIESSYQLKLIQILSDDSLNATQMFTKARQLTADSNITSYVEVYRHLYDEVDKYASGNIAQAIVDIAEAQHKDALVVDKEINFAALLINLIQTIKS